MRVLAQALMDEEVSARIGAELHELSAERTAHRNGDRERRFDTRVGTMALAIPKITPGSYFPGLLEPRRAHEPKRGLAMCFKLIGTAEGGWRRVNAPELVATRPCGCEVRERTVWSSGPIGRTARDHHPDPIHNS